MWYAHQENSERAVHSATKSTLPLMRTGWLINIVKGNMLLVAAALPCEPGTLIVVPLWLLNKCSRNTKTSASRHRLALVFIQHFD